jgi:hypothetical protein
MQASQELTNNPLLKVSQIKVTIFLYLKLCHVT